MAIGIGSDNVESGLVLAIDFANPKSYPGSGTTVYDLSGNGYNGTLTNGPTFSTEYGGACVLDGSNDYIQFANTLLSGTGEFTVSMWFRWTANAYALFANYPAGNLEMLFSSAYIGLFLGNGNLYSDATSNFTRNPLNMVIKRSGTTTYLVINNVQVMTATQSADIGSTTNFRIGANTSGGEVLGGYIYSCAVYNRALSTAEIAQNYNAEVRRFLPTIPVIDSSLILNLDAGNRLSFLNYGGSKSYWCGGSYNNTNVTDKLTYSNDTTAAQTSANLTAARGYPVGNSDGATKGYISGDISPTAATDKLTFSSDTTAAQTTANLSAARGACGGASNYSTKAFAVGGYGAPSLTTSDRIVFSTDTTSAATSANLSTGKSQMTSNLTDINTKGYFAGGSTSGDVVTALTDKITFANDLTIAISTGNIATAKRNPAGLSAISGRGYIAGGYSTAATNNFEKITFANDTTSAVSTATLSQSRWGPNGASEASSKGFICGGYVSGGVATADKITFVTETCAAQSSANLSVGRYLPAAIEEIYNTSSTSILDSSGNNNTGTLTNGVSFGLSNQGSLSFDGSNDYVSIGSQSLVGSGTKTFTVEMWFYNTKTWSAGQYTMFARVKQDTEFFTSLYNSGGTLYANNIFRSYTQYGTPLTTTISDYVNKWIHMVVVYNGGNKDTAAAYNTYINGSAIAQGTVNFGAAGGTGSNCNIIGADGTSGCNASSVFHQGNIGIYRIYTRVLAATEILQNFNADRQRFGV